MFVKFIFLSVFLFILSVSVHAQKNVDRKNLAIINGRANYLPKPIYPQEAKDFCANGKVEVKVSINEKGDVTEAKAISGDELLRGVSVEAVKKAKFAPVMDFPVKTEGIIVYNFDSLAPKCVTAGIVNKKSINLPKPYVSLSPPKKEVVIAVQIIIDETGKVTKARAVLGHPLLRASCEKAARATKFAYTNDLGQIFIRALLVYKFKPDGTIDTNIERDDKTVIGTPINLVEPPPPFCNCRGLGGSVLVQAKIDEQGNVTEANAISGHPVLRFPSEKAALESKFLPTNTKAKIVISYNFESNDGGRTAKLKNIEIRKVEIEK